MNAPAFPFRQMEPPAASTGPVWNARDLTQGGPGAQIVLDGQVYSLRITRAGKLILTK